MRFGCYALCEHPLPCNDEREKEKKKYILLRKLKKRKWQNKNSLPYWKNFLYTLFYFFLSFTPTLSLLPTLTWRHLGVCVGGRRVGRWCYGFPEAEWNPGNPLPHRKMREATTRFEPDDCVVSAIYKYMPYIKRAFRDFSAAGIIIISSVSIFFSPVSSFFALSAPFFFLFSFLCLLESVPENGWV